MAALKASDPELPATLFSRVADNWRPLIAIADLIGGEWPHRARRIAERFAAITGDDTTSILLLNDLRSIFEDTGADALHSEDIIDRLEKMENRPWAEWSRGKPMSKNQLAKVVGLFEVEPKQVKIGGINKRGYRLDVLKKVFSRYLSATPLQPLPNKGLLEDENATGEVAVAFQSTTVADEVEFQTPQNPLEINECSGVTPQRPQKGVFEIEDPFECLRNPDLKLEIDPPASQISSPTGGLQSLTRY
jgi:Protein of unknown function (DUF3631)